jgi:hypothetical protein
MGVERVPGFKSFLFTIIITDSGLYPLLLPSFLNAAKVKDELTG